MKIQVIQSQIMKSTWKIIYCYAILLVTMCSLITVSCLLISNVYDLYYPPKFEDQALMMQFNEKLKNKDFMWDAPEHKKLKEYAIKYYENKNTITKEMLFFVFFIFVSVIHLLILRKSKKDE